MNKASSAIHDGVGSGDYDPRDEIRSLPLFSGLQEIRDRLLSVFAGRTLTFAKIIAEEVAETRFTESNYRDALLDLEKDGAITVVPPADARPMRAGGLNRTLSATARITFS